MKLFNFLRRKKSVIEYFTPQPFKMGDGFVCIPFGGETNIVINPGETKTIITGTSVHLPNNVGMMVVLNPGIVVSRFLTQDCPEILHPGFRGNLRLRVTNHGKRPCYFGSRDLVAQLIPFACPAVDFVEIPLKKVDPKRYERIPDL